MAKGSQHRDSGAALLDYTFLILSITLVAITSLTSLGTKISYQYWYAAYSVDGGTVGSGSELNCDFVDSMYECTVPGESGGEEEL
ncbi:MAG: hypothetical protein KDD64_04140 [Bdellovibrionales bacterium]|nr:hypothetical protein [Bdellovibrionales bacterium]